MLDLESSILIGTADLLEKHNTPPYSPINNDWQCATSFPSCLANAQRRPVIPTVFDGPVFCRSLAVASAPSAAT